MNEKNVFYAVGVKNENFEESPIEKEGSNDQFRLEKFFIEADSFSSKTLAFLEAQDQVILEYNISQN